MMIVHVSVSSRIAKMVTCGYNELNFVYFAVIVEVQYTTVARKIKIIKG